MGPNPATAAREQRRGFRRDIQGIRALGLAVVFLTHAGAGAVEGGFVGLDAFFVISGFLITGLLLQEVERSGTISLMRFYARRVRRLLPLAVVVLLAVLVLSVLVLAPVRVDRVAGDIVAASLYVVNWRFALQSVDYFAIDPEDSPIQHFWSLSVEEQFYLVWPTLLGLAVAWWSRRPSRRSLRRALWAVVALAGLPSLVYSALLVDTSTASYSYFSTFARAWEFALGGALALALPQRLELPGWSVAALSWGGTATIIVTALTFDQAMPYPGTAALLPTLATAAIVVAGTTSIRAGPTRLLSSAPFQYVGDLSYAWYLWHWPALVFARFAWGDLTVAASLAVIAASWIPAALSHHLIEEPFRYSRPLARRPRRALGFGVASMVVAVAAAVGLSVSQPRLSEASADKVVGASAVGSGAALQRTASALRPVPQRADDDRGQAYHDGCLVLQEELEARRCVYGDRDAAKTVVLFGNSHALHYAPALIRLARARGWRLVTFMRAGCPIADVHFAHRCDRWREDALRRIESMEAVDLIVTATTTAFVQGVVVDGERLSLEDSRRPLEHGLTRTLRRLSALGARLVLLADLPRAPVDVPVCVSRYPSNLERCAFEDDRDPAQAFDVRSVRRVEGAEAIDAAALVCPRKRCPAVMGNALVYRDDNHLTATFARTLAPWLGRKLPPI